MLEDDPKFAENFSLAKSEDVLKTKTQIIVPYEYCNGGTLLDLRQSVGKIDHKNNVCIEDERVIHQIARQLVDSLHVLEMLKVVHRDLKEENVFIHFEDQNDSPEQVKLNSQYEFITRNGKVKIGDFGLLVLLDKSKYFSSDRVGGSKPYYSPEMWKIYTDRS